jgi:hypothetical protein
VLYGAGALAREAGYVGLSRVRRTNYLYSPAGNPVVGVDNDVYLASSWPIWASVAHTSWPRANSPPPEIPTGRAPDRSPPDRRNFPMTEPIWLSRQAPC